MTGADGRGGALGQGPPLVDGVHLVGQELQTPPEVSLLSQEVVLVRLYLALLILEGLWVKQVRLSHFVKILLTVLGIGSTLVPGIAYRVLNKKVTGQNNPSFIGLSAAI